MMIVLLGIQVVRMKWSFLFISLVTTKEWSNFTIKERWVESVEILKNWTCQT